MNEIINFKYDERLKAMTHYQNYPEMLPFIGSQWESSDRILLLGESHYLPGEDLIIHFGHKNILDAWYNYNSEDFLEYHKDHINTRRTATMALTGKKYDKSLVLLYNVIDALKNGTNKYNTINESITNFSFLNYFQRPAFVAGGSIQNDENDNDFAYKNLLEVVQIIQTTRIIFLSIKAFESFKTIHSRYKELFFDKFKLIDAVQHPSCAWWNMINSRNSGRTGREKFIDLINSIN